MLVSRALRWVGRRRPAHGRGSWRAIIAVRCREPGRNRWQIYLWRTEKRFRLAAILRLANAFDCDRDRPHHSLGSPAGWIDYHRSPGLLCPRPLGGKVAAARHLLEVVCRRPVMVKQLRTTERARTKTGGSALGSSKPFCHFRTHPSWYLQCMTHAQLVEKAVRWLRSYRCVSLRSCAFRAGLRQRRGAGRHRLEDAHAIPCWWSAKFRAPIFWPIARSPCGRSRRREWAASASICPRRV